MFRPLEETVFCSWLTHVLAICLCNDATLSHSFSAITCSHELGETVLLPVHALLRCERGQSLSWRSLDNSAVQNRYLQQQILLNTKLWLKSIIIFHVHLNAWFYCCLALPVYLMFFGCFSSKFLPVLQFAAVGTEHQFAAEFPWSLCVGKCFICCNFLGDVLEVASYEG